MPEEETASGGLETKQAREPFGWPTWLLAGLIIASLAGLTSPVVIRSKKKSPQAEATSNARQIGIALLEFDTDYGSFPSDATAAMVTGNFPDHGNNLDGRSSNAFFRQLFVAELTQSEAMFYAKVDGARKPDGDIHPGKLLEKGEVGFAYIAGLSSEGNPARPIAFAPVIPGTRKFDPEPFEGKAVFLSIDNSATAIPIETDGRILLNGIDILSAENPIWDGDAPDIRYPE
jgi:hypothetical protein